MRSVMLAFAIVCGALSYDLAQASGLHSDQIRPDANVVHRTSAPVREANTRDGFTPLFQVREVGEHVIVSASSRDKYISFPASELAQVVTTQGKLVNFKSLTGSDSARPLIWMVSPNIRGRMVPLDHDESMARSDVDRRGSSEILHYDIKDEDLFRRATVCRGVHSGKRIDPINVYPCSLRYLGKLILTKHGLRRFASVFNGLQRGIQGPLNEPHAYTSYNQSKQRHQSASEGTIGRKLLGAQILFGASLLLSGFYFLIDAFKRSAALKPSTGALRVGLSTLAIGCGGLLAAFGLASA